MLKSSPGSVLIVVLNFNGWKETIPCIESILAQSYKKFHILLIDNGSKDQSLSKLKRFNNHEGITFHKEPVNLGFAGGVNVGIRKAIDEGYEYVTLLNNDATLEKDWLAILIRTLKKTGASVATGLLLESKGKEIESTGDSYSKYGLPFPRQRGDKTENANDSEFVFGGTAGASVYTTELFKDIGLFDEKFFAYFEDTDISYRTQLAGHTAYYEKSAVAYHDHGTTSSKMPGFTVYQTFKNLPVFLWKDVPLQLFLGTAFRFYACLGLMYVRAIARGQFVIATKGLFKSISLFPHALKERRRIQKSRRVSIEYLQSVIYPALPPNTKREGLRIFHR